SVFVEKMNGIRIRYVPFCHQMLQIVRGLHSALDLSGQTVIVKKHLLPFAASLQTFHSVTHNVRGTSYMHFQSWITRPPCGYELLQANGYLAVILFPIVRHGLFSYFSVII